MMTSGEVARAARLEVLSVSTEETSHSKANLVLFWNLRKPQSEMDAALMT